MTSTNSSAPVVVITGAGGGLGAATASLLTEGMYTGLLSVKVGSVALNSVGIMYLVITLPMIIAATLGYLAGIYDFKIFGGSKKTK